MTTITLSRPDTAEMQEQRVLPVVNRATGLTITDKPTHEAALTMIAEIVRVEREVQDLFAEPKRAAHAAHKAVTEAERKLLVPLASARGVLASKCDQYERTERDRARQEQLRLEEAARAAEEERRTFEAAMADQAGEPEEAAAILDAPVIPPSVHVPTATADVEGVGTQKRYGAEVVDLHALVRYVAERPEWISLLEPSMPNLNRLATAQRENLSIPGVRVVVKTIRTVSRSS